MTFFEESSTPAAPLSGDASVFDNDLVASVKTTSERVVDTQSGFMFVIKYIGERLSFTCKRRVGTPPTSAIVLTPDEALKLSKVLAAAIGGLSGNTGLPTALAGQNQFALPRRKALSLPLALALSAVLVAAAGAIGYISGMKMQAQMLPVATTPSAQPSVDAFTRTFVVQMLDFSPASYRASQVRAMSSMSHDLMYRYWQETNFPLNDQQLKHLPQTAMVVIDRIQQRAVSPNTYSVDVYAQLVHSDSTNNELHIKLKLIKDNTSGLRVVEQEDLSQSDADSKAAH